MHTELRCLAGRPYPLGVSRQPDGTNFAVYSPKATRLWLCLFDENGAEQQLELSERSGAIWHGLVVDLPAGQRYGFRVDGQWQPEQGLWFNPAKLLIDPYAQALTESVTSHSSFYATDPNTDSAPFLPKALTPGPDNFDWQDSQSPQTPWSQTLIYELHVKGFTQRHPDIPDVLRGRYLGIAHPASLDYLTSLGVTAVQLMPCFAFMTEQRLVDLGLTNYWGYNPVGFFAPEPRYAVDDAVTEFKTMVRALHQAGIEVIMDVVYNHSAEGNQAGPVLNLKALANDHYYRHPEHQGGSYLDYSGCGNSLDLGQDATLRLVMDSLRHWRQHYQIDGFRFDLAASLGREAEAFSGQASFFKVVQQDPQLAGCKLIAEPWDLGPQGYQAGQFPVGWVECNDAYRDTLRRFWRGDDHQLSAFIDALQGSPQRFGESRAGASQSLNLITYHDGYTLADLVSYEQRHNQANGEDNRDGHGENFSRNWGVEGDTTETDIIALRHRTQRNLLASLLLSPGPIHLLAGDELGRSQAGNNNAYCQDNELSWLGWSAKDNALIDFVQRCIALRNSGLFDTGAAKEYRLPDGQMLHQTADQNEPNAVAIKLNEALWLLCNATEKAQNFLLTEGHWQLLLSSDPEGVSSGNGQHECLLTPWSLAVIQSD
ncbi:glycogen debranching protein GlgX [Saccharospirillum sp. HFRX-1]|uniref:glycogen debranching protein GlgX n=1 Tax=unclassified Saccharospirillum TaxID=2633430 RepID=UPI00371EBA61